MNDLSIPNPSAPLALHRGADELPFVTLDSDGNVASILDAGAVLELHLGRCAEMGVARPRVIGT